MAVQSGGQVLWGVDRNIGRKSINGTKTIPSCPDCIGLVIETAVKFSAENFPSIA